MKTKIDIFPFQEKIIKSNKSIIVAICGRSSGKSHIASYWAFKKMVECDGMGIITAPVYTQAEVPIKYLIKILNDYGIKYVFNKTPQFADSPLPSHGNILSALINGKLKQVKMASADVEDNLRSGSYSWSLIDEACYVSEEAFMVLSPTLRGQGNDFNYQTLLISSPAGKNWVYSNFIENPSDHVEVIRAKSSENIFQVNDEKMKIWKETMSSRMYLQEIEAEILDSNINSIFYSYSKDILINQKVEGNKFIVSLDQNVSPGAGTIIQKRNTMFHVIDEIYIDDGANFESYIREIKKKVPINSVIDLCGDSSGNARNVSAIQTFYSSVQKGLQSSGYIVYDKTNKSNPKVYESREEVNRLIERKLLFVDPKCKHLIKDFELASWKAKGIFETDKAKYDPHIAESLVYGIWSFRQNQFATVSNISH
jgi:hypothetical protein